MNVATWNSIMNDSSTDFDGDYSPTLADAIGYAEFEEECANWEDVVEE